MGNQGFKGVRTFLAQGTNHYHPLDFHEPRFVGGLVSCNFFTPSFLRELLPDSRDGQ